MNAMDKNRIKNNAAHTNATHTNALKKRGGFAVTRNFFIYLIILLGALIFTQALRSPLSALMYVFVLALPFASALYAAAAFAAVKVFLPRSAGEVQKNAPYKINLFIINEFIFPYPSVEADVMLPDDNAVRCVEKRVSVSLAPLSYYNIAEQIEFKYRGEYKIGVSKLYIYDLFKMFRFTKNAGDFNTVFVIPRRLTADESAGSAASDVNTDSMKNAVGVDRSELSEIRGYRSGDHIKTIHWKMSSKTQELMVKEYAMNSGKNIFVFVDTAAHFSVSAGSEFAEDINEYMADGVIELAAAVVDRELREGNSCTMIWYDDRTESGAQVFQLQTPEDLDRVFRTFATVGLAPPDRRVGELAGLVEETQAVTMIFVTGVIDKTLTESLSDIALVYGNISSQSSIDLYHYPVEKKILGRNEREVYMEYEKTCRDQLTANGIKINETNFQ